MKTENTGQVSVGVVKAPGILHEKIATQHPAEWHLIEGREFTLVTTRNSGTSCFNLVKLQNGVDGRAEQICRYFCEVQNRQRKSSGRRSQ